MSLRNKAIKGVIWSVIDSWGRRIFSIFTFFLLARLLGPEAFGLVALASVFIAFVQIFLDQGFSQAIVQRQTLEPEHLDTAFWVNISISLVLMGLSIACADWTASLFNQPDLAPVVRWLSLGFLFSGLSSVQQAIFQRQMEFKALATRSLLAAVAGGFLGIGMALMGCGVWSLVAQQLTNGLVQTLMLWWLSDWRPKLTFSQSHFQTLFTFGINVMGSNLLSFFNRRSDDFLIGYFLGPVALGYYSVAYRLLLIITELFTSVTAKVALPAFAQLQTEPDRLRRALYQGIQITCFITFPGFLVTAATAPELVKVLFGQQWLASIPVMQILSLVGPLYAYLYFNSPLMVAMGKPSWKLAADFVQAFCVLIAFAIAVRWGIVAVAAAYTICTYLLAPFNVWLIHRLIKLDIGVYLRQCLVPFIGSIAMVFSIVGIRFLFHSALSDLSLLLLSLALGLTVYIGIVAVLEPRLLQKVSSLKAKVP